MVSTVEAVQEAFSKATPELCKGCWYREDIIAMHPYQKKPRNVGHCAKVTMMRVVDPATIRPKPSPAFITPQNIVFNPRLPCADRVREDKSCGFEPVPWVRKAMRLLKKLVLS